ncbi:hypothetical protein BN1221_02170c [Brenneria goodwinii]|uniref:Uncharacterized protein n=1 Tax=Brenneria goodwinii TaxID=1109412 RepID=A0A0G4JVL9_9GAMM|nr:hypothetical protein BN1221_02170c [Brenneria goodwinii]
MTAQIQNSASVRGAHYTRNPFDRKPLKMKKCSTADKKSNTAVKRAITA